MRKINLAYAFLACCLLPTKGFCEADADFSSSVSESALDLSAEEPPLAEDAARIDSLEEQVRNLTGKIEKIGHHLKVLRGRLDKLESSSQRSVQQKAHEDAREPETTEKKTAQEETSRSVDSTSLYEKGLNAFKQKDWIQARQEFSRFIKKFPQDTSRLPSVYYRVGLSYWYQKNYEKAAKWLAVGYKKFPKSAESVKMLEKLVECFTKLGKEADAQILRDKIKKLKENT